MKYSQKLYSSKHNRIPAETKPMLTFAGDQWDTSTELKDGKTVEWRRVRSVLVDFFRGPQVNSVRRKGLELFIQFTLLNGKLFFCICHTIFPCPEKISVQREF